MAYFDDVWIRHWASLSSDNSLPPIRSHAATWNRPCSIWNNYPVSVHHVQSYINRYHCNMHTSITLNHIKCSEIVRLEIDETKIFFLVETSFLSVLCYFAIGVYMHDIRWYTEVASRLKAQDRYYLHAMADISADPRLSCSAVGVSEQILHVSYFCTFHNSTNTVVLNHITSISIGCHRLALKDGILVWW